MRGVLFYGLAPSFIENAADAVLFDAWKADCYVVLKPEFSGPKEGVLIPRADLFFDGDPTASSRVQDARIYPNRRAVSEAASAYPTNLGPFLGYYYGWGTTIWPSVFSRGTTPGIVEACKKLDDAFRAEMRAEAEAFRKLAWWYVGLRTVPVIRMGGDAAELAGLGKAAAISGSFDAATVASELATATKETVGNGPKLIQAAKMLSQMSTLTAAQKVEVILLFIRGIGYAISKEGVVDEGASLLMKSEDARFAFRFIKATGQILYGKFDVSTMEYTFSPLK